MSDSTHDDFNLDELLHPANAFGHPSEVVNDPDLTLNEKRAILASWASDACAIEAAPELRARPQGSPVRFDDIMDALRSMRANRWEMIRYVIIPSLVPWILSSVKIAVGIGFVSAVVGEMVGSTKGLGWYVTQSLNQFDMTGGVTSLIIMAVLALILYSIVGAIERRVCRWQASSTAARTVTM